MDQIINEDLLNRVFQLLNLVAPTLPNDINYSLNLLQGGWLDSLAVVELGAKIEKEFGCKVSSDFYTIRSLRSVETISAYIERKMSEVGEHESTRTSI